MAAGLGISAAACRLRHEEFIVRTVNGQKQVQFGHGPRPALAACSSSCSHSNVQQVNWRRCKALQFLLLSRESQGP